MDRAIMKRIAGLLQEWGSFVADNLDFADEYGESIIYRCAKFGGYTEQGDSGSKILCPDMPPHLRKIEVAVKTLPGYERKCVTAFYCSPLKDDGNPFTKRELALLLKTSKYNFDRYLSRGRQRLDKLLF
jgi:hypothetical protein